MINFRNQIKGKKAFLPFVTAGDPTLDDTKRFIKELIKAGASIIEIGIPFSDPIAEGKTIMAASDRALKASFSGEEATADESFDFVSFDFASSPC